MGVRRPKTLIAIAIVVALSTFLFLIEGPARLLPPEEQIPDHIVIRMHPKFGGETVATLTNKQEIERVMTAMPTHYTSPMCACLSRYSLEFYAPTGIFRTLWYEPGFMDTHIVDSAHPGGQSSAPRKFRRVMKGFITR